MHAWVAVQRGATRNAHQSGNRRQLTVLTLALGRVPSSSTSVATGLGAAMYCGSLLRDARLHHVAGSHVQFLPRQLSPTKVPPAAQKAVQTTSATTSHTTRPRISKTTPAMVDDEGAATSGALSACPTPKRRAIKITESNEETPQTKKHAANAVLRRPPLLAALHIPGTLNSKHGTHVLPSRATTGGVRTVARSEGNHESLTTEGAHSATRETATAA